MIHKLCIKHNDPCEPRWHLEVEKLDLMTKYKQLLQSTRMNLTWYASKSQIGCGTCRNITNILILIGTILNTFSHGCIVSHVKNSNADNVQLTFCKFYVFILIVRRIKTMVWVITLPVDIWYWTLQIDAVGKGTAKALCCMGAVIKYMLLHGVLEK